MEKPTIVKEFQKEFRTRDGTVATRVQSVLPLLGLMLFFFAMNPGDATPPPPELFVESSPAIRRAQAAITISANAAGAASAFASRQYSARAGSSLRPRERAALRDCVFVIADSADQLRRLAEELRRTARGSVGWRVSNAWTWTSAALTDLDMCLGSLKEAAGGTVGIRSEMWLRVVGVVRVTRNALALVSKLGFR